ncbi:hypothetical protein AB4140_02205 [Shewanella sp. 10N.286.51.B2]|uniref:hypothetical protein n=1 Tax=Shewanella sp. 10N.286.51.B2 TaxID=3229707 RepID=UPI00354FBBEF
MSKLIIDLAFLKDLKKRNPAYIRQAIADLRGYEDATIVFGETGIGCTPHYELTFPNGTKLPKNGTNHKPFKFTSDVPKEDRAFNPGNVSRTFKLAEMDSL